MAVKKDVTSKQEKPKSIDFGEFAGMWEGREISQADLRAKAWKCRQASVTLFTYNVKDFRFIPGVKLLEY